jgi:hypothetical protein
MIEIPKICPFCGHQVVKTSNREIYGKEYGNGICYLCRNCRASVGTHPNGEPLGILANTEMKRLKMLCHSHFDIVWKSGILKRGTAYHILSEKLNIPAEDCHFGYFNIDMLKKSLEMLKNKEWYN